MIPYFSFGSSLLTLWSKFAIFVWFFSFHSSEPREMYKNFQICIFLLVILSIYALYIARLYYLVRIFLRIFTFILCSNWFICNNSLYPKVYFKKTYLSPYLKPTINVQNLSQHVVIEHFDITTTKYVNIHTKCNT